MRWPSRCATTIRRQACLADECVCTTALKEIWHSKFSVGKATTKPTRSHAHVLEHLGSTSSLNIGAVAKTALPLMIEFDGIYRAASRRLTSSGSPTSTEPGIGQEAPIARGQSWSHVVGSTGAPSTLSSSATQVRSPQLATFCTSSTAMMSNRVDVKNGGRNDAAT